jgi:hypothetical protein
LEGSEKEKVHLRRSPDREADAQGVDSKEPSDEEAVKTVFDAINGDPEAKEKIQILKEIYQREKENSEKNKPREYTTCFHFGCKELATNMFNNIPLCDKHYRQKLPIKKEKEPSDDLTFTKEEMGEAHAEGYIKGKKEQKQKDIKKFLDDIKKYDKFPLELYEKWEQKRK